MDTFETQNYVLWCEKWYVVFRMDVSIVLINGVYTDTLQLNYVIRIEWTVRNSRFCCGAMGGRSFLIKNYQSSVARYVRLIWLRWSTSDWLSGLYWWCGESVGAECFAQAKGHYFLLNNLGLSMTFIINIDSMLAYRFIQIRDLFNLFVW